MNHLVKEAISRIEIPSKVEKIISLGEMPEMKADPDMVLRVLTNLILNGIQAMQEVGTLHVETRAGKDYIEVAIGDTGVGIPKENMNKLFTPLFSTKAKGVGLGLYISKRLVEAHGGSITVRSKQAEGSTFTVRLPISKKEQR